MGEGASRRHHVESQVKVAVGLTLALIVLSSLATPPARAWSLQPEKLSPGSSLVVEIAGLPKATRAVVKVTGPDFRETITPRARSAKPQRITLRGLKPGRYQVSAKKTEVARDWKFVEKGAEASFLLPRPSTS